MQRDPKAIKKLHPVQFERKRELRRFIDCYMKWIPESRCLAGKWADAAAGGENFPRVSHVCKTRVRGPVNESTASEIRSSKAFHFSTGRRALRPDSAILNRSLALLSSLPSHRISDGRFLLGHRSRHVLHLQ